MASFTVRLKHRGTWVGFFASEARVLFEDVIGGGELAGIVLEGDPLRYGDVPEPHRRPRSSTSCFRHVQSVVVQELHLADLLLDPALDHLLQRLLQRRIVQVDAVSQDVDVQEVLLLLPGRAQLDGREYVHTCLCAGGTERRPLPEHCRDPSRPARGCRAAAALATSSSGVSVPSENFVWVCRSTGQVRFMSDPAPRWGSRRGIPGPEGRPLSPEGPAARRRSGRRRPVAPSAAP